MTVHCPNCSATVLEGNFCTSCGKSLSPSGGPEFVDNVWRARPDEFAARIHVSDLDGFFKKKLTVEKGTKALVMEEGKNVGVVDPGEYTLDSFLGTINRFGKRKDITVVIVKDTDFPLEFSVSGCLTKEYLSLDVKASFDVRLADAAVFVTNLLGERDVFTTGDLKRTLYRFVTLNLRQSIGQCGIDELSRDFSLQKRFDSALAASLRETLEPYGLAFAKVRTFDFKHEAYDELNRKKGECYLLITREQAELEQRKLMEDVYDKSEQQRIKNLERAQERRKLEQDLLVDGEEGDLAVKARRFEEIEKRQRDLEDARTMSGVEADARMERFLAEARRDNLLREADLAEMERKLAEKTEDARSLREHAIRLLEIARQEELETLRAASLQRLGTQRLKDAAELAEKVDSEENRRRKVELDRRLEEEDFRRAETLRDAEAAKQADAIAVDTERNRDKLRQDRLANALKTMEQLDEQERKAQEWQQKREQEDLRLAHELKMEEEKTAAELERQRMAAKAALSPEALITETSADKAAILADALKGKYAAQAESVANERGREREMYERIIAQGEAAAKNVAQAHADAARLVRESADAAMDRLGSVAAEQARSFGSVAAAAGAGAGVAGAAARGPAAASGGKVALRCPKCKAENPPDARHCGNCGEAL